MGSKNKPETKSQWKMPIIIPSALPLRFRASALPLQKPGVGWRQETSSHTLTSSTYLVLGVFLHSLNLIDSETYLFLLSFFPSPPPPPPRGYISQSNRVSKNYFQDLYPGQLKTISSYSFHSTLLPGPSQTFSHGPFTNPPSDPELVP